MQKKKILVLTDTLPWGHRSIAKAIYSYLKLKEKKDNWKVEWAEVEATPTKKINDFYMFYYRFLPRIGGITHGFVESKFLRKKYLDTVKGNFPELVDKIKEVQPDLVISAYWYHSQVLAKLKKERNLKYKLWTVVADPWSINGLSFVEGADLHLVYDKVITEGMAKFGFTKDKILETGWWVRQEMYDEKLKTQSSKLKIKRKLGFTDDRPVIFVGGGSLGTAAIIKLLPALMSVKKPLGVIFNTGTDKLAYNMVEEYAKLFKKLRRSDLVQIKNLGWIENMAEVLSVCDIVFGKAGPNFLFDVVAVGKPFVAITHIGGQEDGNIDLIKKKKLGWVKEDGNSAAEFLWRYLNDPAKFTEEFKETISAESERNKDSLRKIYQRIKADL